MNKWIHWGMIVLLAFALFGCRSTAKTSAMPQEMQQTYGLESRKQGTNDWPAPTQVPQVAPRYQVADTGTSGVELTTIPENIERKIIYNVYMELIVQDTQTTLNQIRQLSEEMGGFVANANTWKDNEQLRGTLTVRIPADRLEEALSKFKALALDIEKEQMDSQDVTEEYVDLEARLTNLQRTEKELLELLETRSATGKTADILEVHREITAVRAQIEQIQGRMKYLNNLSALATVQITLTPDKLLQPVVVGGWRPQGTAREAIRALIRTLQFFADVVIVFVLYILPVLIILSIPVVGLILIVRAAWKRAKQRRQAQKAIVNQ